jgi:hypothetical protein
LQQTIGELPREELVRLIVKREKELMEAHKTISDLKMENEALKQTAAARENEWEQ